MGDRAFAVRNGLTRKLEETVAPDHSVLYSLPLQVRCAEVLTLAQRGALTLLLLASSW